MRAVFFEFEVLLGHGESAETYPMLVSLDAIRSIEPSTGAGDHALVVLEGSVTDADTTITQFRTVKPYTEIRELLRHNAYTQTVVVPC
ncbi:Uncharacterised protein [Mycobacteroides abscessus subsp. abscessus]|uniref:hypothetical protein n=1 Tax=Mycobacteroides abscessus TaxID=36809 RepID=UPI00092C38BF|nr:hypothetical protein [Mycobacteroides abscessus]QSM01907.1 hypothetical protein PROPHIGD11-3_11 [Mycobacterium phage prophiGD11-3]QSM04534.1 hypothetical protein PROPHIGD08-3_11 [Mycobacterium phage prophiGD08-3]MBE5409506.1 hypothetical protein [Mycobacteroides abscessus]MBN7350751.1 hypothetical protein [Mycobacteroides abscessus subsp. abscessus]MBN7520720.1 hypothetical protein [Mycobacteroides abscessus subsp. abscessus]